MPGKINSGTHDSNPNFYKTHREAKTVCPHCETCGKTNHSAQRCYVGANAANKPFPWKSKLQQQDAQDSITGCVRATAQHLIYNCQIFTPEQWLTDRRPAAEYSINPMCCLAAISGDICEEIKLANFQNDSTAETNENTHTLQLKQRNDVESQRSSLKEKSPEIPEILRNVPQNCRSWSSTSINSANIKYTLHTLLIAQIQNKREYLLFNIFNRGFSNWAPSTSPTERHKQTIWCPVACTAVAAGSRTN